MLSGKGNDGGVPAKRGGDRGALEVVGRHQPEGGPLLDVAMRLNAAGQDKQVRGVDFLSSFAKIAAKGHDLTVGNADVAFHFRGRGHHRALPDNKIEVGHLALLSSHEIAMTGCAYAMRARPQD